MTSDTNLPAMEPGEALNRLVAEKVMGATPGHVPEGWPHFSDEDGCSHPALPAFSTDIAAAWEVVEKMEGEDFWVSLVRKTFTLRPIRNETAESPEEGPFWYAYFRCVRAGIRGDHEANAPTAPHAICLAALAALKADRGAE